MPLYSQLEAYAGDSKTLGEVFRTALEYFIKHMHTASTKSAVIRSNTDNPKSTGVKESNEQPTKTYGTWLRKNLQPKYRSDNFEV